MTDEQLRALAGFLNGLNDLTAATGVKVCHHDLITLEFVEDAVQVRMRGAYDDERGYLIETSS